MAQEPQSSSPAEEPESSSNPANDLVKYFTEFDQACALVGANQTLDFIEEESTREACHVIANFANMCRMNYAVLRNNEDFRRQQEEGPMSITPHMPNN